MYIYKLEYSWMNEKMEITTDFTRLFTSPKNVLKEIRETVKNPEKVKYADHSTKKVKHFRFATLKPKLECSNIHRYYLKGVKRMEVNRPIT